MSPEERLLEAVRSEVWSKAIAAIRAYGDLHERAGIERAAIVADCFAKREPEYGNLLQSGIQLGAQRISEALRKIARKPRLPFPAPSLEEKPKTWCDPRSWPKQFQYILGRPPWADDEDASTKAKEPQR